MVADRQVSNTHEIDQLAASYWEFFLGEHPVTAMDCGVQKNNHIFFKDAIEDFDHRHRRHLEFRNQLEKLADNSLQGESETTRKLLLRELDEAIQEYELQAHLRPLWFPFGPEMAVSFAIQTTDLSGTDAIDTFITRLQSIPAYFTHCQERLEIGIQQGFRVPEVLVQRILANVRGYLKAPEDETGCWYMPLRRISQVKPTAYDMARQRIESVVANELLPAWQKFADTLETLMTANSRQSISCLDDPHGAAYYEFLVKHHTTLDLTPGDIHEIGLSEVAKIAAEMKSLVSDSDNFDDITSMRKYLQSDPQFIASSKQELLGQIEMLSKKIDRKIPEFFGVIPRMTYGIESIPEEIAAQMPPAYAQPNPANRKQAGIHWVTSLPEQCPSYQHVPLALHEAWPGHLMHIALMKENRGLPEFRRHSFMNYTSLIEGWALYCERLGIEFGLYHDEYQHMGRLEMELWRAMRLVVDTGIHAKGWSRNRAVSYMENNSSLIRPVIESEVDRYIGMPAQALAYKLGEMKIMELREHTKMALEGQFNIRNFHDCVMRAGAVTLPILEEHVRNWVANEGR